MDFNAIGRLPAAGDNAAIATRRIDAGTEILFDGELCSLSHVVLEGHRFAVADIPAGSTLRSWGLPFGEALRDIRPGDYLCNAGMLEALDLRNPGFALPGAANFADYRRPYALDEAGYRPGTQVARLAQPGHFEGFARAGNRGAGTRNDIVILGTTSRTASFARALENRFGPELREFGNIDGVVSVCHTEGGDPGRPNNLELVLRTLSGFMIHPNVAAVLAVDYGTEALTNAMLETYLRHHGYPIDFVLHRFYSLEKDFETSLDEAEGIVRSWLTAADAMQRTPQPLREIRIALQCGGSDAFSGISGNPLAGRIAREFIRHGGSAALAETDELIGAEPYILANTRDLETARCFLSKIEQFKERIAWHGYSSEGNTTGGNKFRGLYNNALKSIGAARKKDPDVCLDYVIDYGQRMKDPGFYFMDSPGNDLESIAGQVASGCNLIFFVTGNGSITNFPFVPTIKFMTTTARWKLLSRDMDVNAGRYQDGETLESLSRETFSISVDIASGNRSAGERAGHSQVSIWRNWRQSNGLQLETLLQRRRPGGRGIDIPPSPGTDYRIQALATDYGPATDQVGLIAPTSLCAGQIALRIAAELNAGLRESKGCVSRFVALPHTEGCGASSGENETIYTRTLIGHLLHPFVKAALLLEHGCEHTHNDLMRSAMRQHGVDPDRFGYASIQLDGGIEKVVRKVQRWFADRLGERAFPVRRETGLDALSLGVLSTGTPPAATALALAHVASTIVGNGGVVVVPRNAALLDSHEFLRKLGLDSPPNASLDYGQVADQQGLHVMSTPTAHAVETLTGLGGTGVELVLAFVSDTPIQTHPMIPVLQIASSNAEDRRFSGDMDLIVPAGASDARTLAGQLLRLVCDTASDVYRPRLWSAGVTDFQLTRGLLGVSL